MRLSCIPKNSQSLICLFRTTSNNLIFFRLNDFIIDKRSTFQCEFTREKFDIIRKKYDRVLKYE